MSPERIFSQVAQGAFSVTEIERQGSGDALNATPTPTATEAPTPTPTEPPTPTPTSTPRAAVLYVASGTTGVQRSLYTIDPATAALLTTVGPLHGQAVSTGSTGIGSANGGGFASDRTGLLFGISNLSFYSFNSTNGNATLIGATNLGNLVKAADFSPSNVFYALEGGGGVDNTHLRWLDTCDVTTGNCTRVGQINAQDLDALAFIP